MNKSGKIEQAAEVVALNRCCKKCGGVLQVRRVPCPIPPIPFCADCKAFDIPAYVPMDGVAA